TDHTSTVSVSTMITLAPTLPLTPYMTLLRTRMRQPGSSTTGCSPPPTSTSDRCSPTSQRQLRAAAGRSQHHPLASANACATAVLRAPQPASNAVPHARSPCAAYTPCCARSLLDASRAFRLLASLQASSQLRRSSFLNSRQCGSRIPYIPAFSRTL